ncbi:MEDS domain-containing protein [Pseudonocardia xinjiangensis]|uniref:MEDS domain-containing protein n=1 Tax=Pseudonocardia xinjiangensis TaxID=75289 RepID=UPI003D903319
MQAGHPDAPLAASAAHAVALYGSDAELRRMVLPFVREGLHGGEAVVAAVSEQAAAVLCEGLGKARNDVRWAVPGLTYTSLGPASEAVRSYLAEQHEAGTPVRLLAENATGGPAGRTAAYLRLDAVSSEVYGVYGFPWACLYDRRRYPAEVLEQVVQVHPLLLGADGRAAGNGAYVSPEAYLAAHPGPLSPVPPTVALDVTLTTGSELSAVRNRAAAAAGLLGLPVADTRDLELGAGEVIANALEHGVLPCRVRLWGEAGQVVVRVDDRGPGDGVATAGFRRPPLDSRSGMGLWIARQLADVVHVGTGVDGNAVELRFGAVARGGGRDAA